MASQLVSDGRCQTLSRRKSYGYHRIENSIIYPQESNFKEHKNKESSHEKGAKRSTNLAQAQKLHRLGFSYLATSFLYIVIKVKAFYNGFLGDVASESRIMGIDAPMAEPYFSVPVIPN